MISKRALVYAKSLFAVSPEEVTLKELEVFSAFLTQKMIFKFFDSPLIDLDEKKQILKGSCKGFSLFFINFLFLIIERKLLPLFSEIKQAFQDLLNEKHNRLQGEVLSSTGLSPKEKQDLEISLKSFFKKDLELKNKKTSQLIGGLHVRAGGYAFNDTLSFHLNKFKTQGE